MPEVEHTDNITLFKKQFSAEDEIVQQEIEAIKQIMTAFEHEKAEIARDLDELKKVDALLEKTHYVYMQIMTKAMEASTVISKGDNAIQSEAEEVTKLIQLYVELSDKANELQSALQQKHDEHTKKLEGKILGSLQEKIVKLEEKKMTITRKILGGGTAGTIRGGANELTKKIVDKLYTKK